LKGKKERRRKAEKQRVSLNLKQVETSLQTTSKPKISRNYKKKNERKKRKKQKKDQENKE